jgi:hypothetical protein
VTLPSVKTTYTERSEPGEDTAEEARNRAKRGTGPWWRVGPKIRTVQPGRSAGGQRSGIDDGCNDNHGAAQRQS